VVCLSYGELGVWREEARTSLALLGRILGREQRAEEINTYIDGLQRDLAERAGSAGTAEKLSAYFGGISFKGSHGLTSTQAGYPPAEMVNAANPADTLDKKGHLFVDKEQILVWDPDVVFIDIGSRANIEHDFAGNRDFYRLLKAAHNNRVFSLLPYNYYNTNIELALLNAFFVGKCLYPAAFNDIDMDRKAGEIFSTFLGIAAEKQIPAYHVVRFPEKGPIVWEQ
jgi:iron complex transport system substrate-binding protein